MKLNQDEINRLSVIATHSVMPREHLLAIANLKGPAERVAREILGERCGNENEALAARDFADWASSLRAHKPLDDNWMRVGPNTDAAIWRPWGRETGEL